jgi:nicotinate dehydrogenase subunit A
LTTFTLNNQKIALSLNEQYPLIDVLRNHCSIDSPKWGCGLEQCGACHVLIDGKSKSTCQSPLASVEGQSIQTLESASLDDSKHLTHQKQLRALQQAFLIEQAAQCGYCTSGMLMTSAELLFKNKTPTEEQIKIALDGHLCRCGAQQRIVRAVMLAAHNLSKEQA